MGGFAVLGLVGIAVMTAALYGWGRLARSLAGLPKGTWPLTAALGMASQLFLGGLLNLCHLAYPAAFAVLTVGGLAMTAQVLWRHRPWYPKMPGPYGLLWSVLVIVLCGFVSATQLKPRLFNPRDDLENFFSHAVRMMETGTLYGSPLNALGAEGFGGQAFLQGFVTGFFPLPFINAADAVFCFFLCLALTGSVAFRRDFPWPAAITATLAIFIINPQYVNISSLYSTAALVSALAIASADPRERDDLTGWRPAIVPALLYAGIVALKPTGLVFAGLHWGLTGLAACRATGNWRAGLRQAGRVAGMGCVFLAPWLLLYAPYYWLGLAHPLPAASIAVSANPADETIGLRSLFSFNQMLYGGSMLAYTSIAAGLILCAFFALKRQRGNPQDRVAGGALAATAVAAAMSYLFWVIYGPQLQELGSTTRYAVPFLIGGSSAALPLLRMIDGRRNLMACALTLALLLVFFAVPMRQRVGLLAHQGTQLSYLHHWSGAAIADEERFQQEVLGEQGGVIVHQMQEAIPQGQTLLAWTRLSFLLDYGRNTIIDINVAGMGQPWSRIPAAKYALFQFGYHGAPSDDELLSDIGMIRRRVGMLAARALDAKHYLQSIPGSTVLRRKENMELIRFGHDISWPQP